MHLGYISASSFCFSAALFHQRRERDRLDVPYFSPGHAVSACIYKLLPIEYNHYKTNREAFEMRISTKCSIALHCLILISEYENKVKVTSELLAKSTGCNSAAVRSILNALQKAELISVVRGIGGAHLSKNPESITIWEVYHALEPDGLEHFIGFHPNPSAQCPVGRRIGSVLKKPYTQIGDAVRESMQEITLQQLLDDYRCMDEM